MMQGKYTADGTTKILEVPFDANWLRIENLTQIAAAGAGQAIKAGWQQDQPYGTVTTKTAATNASIDTVLTAANAITKVNTGDNPRGVNLALTGVSADAHPRLTLGATTGLYNGGIIQIRSANAAAPAVGATQLQGMDFTIGSVGANNELTYMVPIAVAAPPAGVAYHMKYDKTVYPRSRFIVDITQAEQAVVTMSVTHEYSIGDYVRLMVPPEYGMEEANLKEVKIVDSTVNFAANTNTITVDLDTRGFTAFAFPVDKIILSGKAEVIPVTGPGTNPQVRGFQIMPGAANPGGVANDVIYWVAGNSWNV